MEVRRSKLHVGQVTGEEESSAGLGLKFPKHVLITGWLEHALGGHHGDESSLGVTNADIDCPAWRSPVMGYVINNDLEPSGFVLEEVQEVGFLGVFIQADDDFYARIEENPVLRECLAE